MQSLGRSTLVVRPEYGRTTQTSVNPYTQADINHLTLKLFTTAEQDLSISKDLVNAQLGNAIAFSNLKNNTNYRIRAYAYATSGTGSCISTNDSGSYTDVLVGTDDRPTLATLSVKLIDKDFNGQGTGSLQITNGGYILPDPEAMALRHSQVSTFAGFPLATGSENGLGTAARFNVPRGLAVDSSGNLYVTEYISHTIRKITPDGMVSLFAGTPGGTGTADGMGTAAQFCNPMGITADSGGNLYVTDRSNHTIRKITPAGVVTTLAGSPGVSGTSDGAVGVAKFNAPYAVAADTSGNVYVADSYNHTIRKISGGVVTTLAGTPTVPGSQDGTGIQAQFRTPIGLVVDAAGNLFVADYETHAIRKITGNVVTTVAGAYGMANSVDGIGTAAYFKHPNGIAIDSTGALFVSDQDSNLIRRIGTGYVVTTIAGSSGQTGTADGIGANALFNSPRNLAVDPQGNLFVVDSGNQTIRMLR